MFARCNIGRSAFEPMPSVVRTDDTAADTEQAVPPVRTMLLPPIESGPMPGAGEDTPKI